MTGRLRIIFFLAGVIPFLNAQEIPQVLQGRWRVARIIPTSTISCWGYAEARTLIGTEIDYQANAFRWKDFSASHPGVAASTLSAEQFHQEYSGRGAADSQVSFAELGIRGPTILRITLTHPDANITGATVEIPGDEVFIKNRNTIVFSVCNVYFEAHRNHRKSATRR